MENEEIQEDVIEEEVLPSETDEEKKAGDENEAKGLNRDGSAKQQDLLKTELEKVQKQGRSKREKLLFTKQRVDQQLSELDDEEGVIHDDDDKPVTVGMLKKIQTENATKTALQLADEISDETERELTKYHIENTIRPTGDPKKDLELAQVHVNAVKNSRIIEEITRKPEAKRTPSSGGSNPKDGKIDEELTPQELMFVRPPFNLTKEQVLKTRLAR